MRCVLCARRGKVTEGESHVCVNCGAWLQVQVADIARLAADAAAYIEPGSASGAGVRSVPGSKPPLRVEALDPELTPVGPPPSATVLEVLESWCRLIREERQLTPYGPASAAYAAQVARNGDLGHRDGIYLAGRPNDTRVTLIGCVAFLGAQVSWMTTEPDFPIDDFADEVVACVRVLRKFDSTRQASTGREVECPHDNGEQTCGFPFRIDGNDVDSYFTCPRCGSEWSVDRLMLVWAETTDAAMWLDAEAVIGRFGIDRTTLSRWVREGKVVKSHGRYDIKPIALAQRRGA